MPSGNPNNITVAPDYAGLCRVAVEAILHEVEAAVRTHGRCAIALSGGSTPAGVYTLMASPDYRDRFPWPNIHLFFGDERFVPADSPRSNYAMVKQTLLANVSIPPENVHTIDTAAPDAEAAAARYGLELVSFFGLKPGEVPRFDIVLLGLGEDGHTASLFPGTAAAGEQARLAVAVRSGSVPEPRVSLTLPVLNNAAHVFFVVSGSAKAGILAQVLEGGTGPALPAALVRPSSGKIRWFMDQAAAQRLAPA